MLINKRTGKQVTMGDRIPDPHSDIPGKEMTVSKIHVSPRPRKHISEPVVYDVQVVCWHDSIRGQAVNYRHYEPFELDCEWIQP